MNLGDICGIKEDFKVTVERNGRIISDSSVIGVFGTIKKYLKRIWRLRVVMISVNPGKSVIIFVNGSKMIIKENKDVSSK